ncbi:hypothetical protein [Dickeya lacustris]|uniref:Uncharacterized protein n=1 Tax=Dickeya lacustris TaxID=2259638 RepID=A0ABY8G7G6_9GAMM|nr:hypothetical protein [Dickeya lacustris]WFN55906.1 hypothetical protein O1Q98_00800 [Dickeya lacustris]
MQQKRRASQFTLIGVVLTSLFSQAASAADDNVIKLIKKNDLDNTRVLTMYQNGGLVVATETPNKLILVNPKVKITNENADNAMSWYRGMQFAEYKTFDANKYKTLPCVQQDSFCGITPEYNYAKEYLTIQNPGVMIEFRTIEPGWLYNDFSTKHHCQIKAEGGGTYGLGQKGTSGSCDADYKKQGLGNIFNTWLQAPQKIDPIIAYVLLAK